LRNKYKINKELINKAIIIFKQQQIFYLIKIDYKSSTKSNKKQKKKNKQKSNTKLSNTNSID